VGRTQADPTRIASDAAMWWVLRARESGGFRRYPRAAANLAATASQFTTFHHASR
jgi:hypothetical protein